MQPTEQETIETRLATDPLKFAREVAGINEPNFWCSLQPGDDVEGARVYNAKNSASHAIADVVGRIFEVEHVLFHRVTSEEADGEIKEYTRFVLITKDGNNVAGCGAVSVNNLLMLLQSCGMPPWKSTKFLRIDSFKNKHGGRCYTFTIMDKAGKPIGGEPKAKKPAE